MHRFSPLFRPLLDFVERYRENYQRAEKQGRQSVGSMFLFRNSLGRHFFLFLPMSHFGIWFSVVSFEPIVFAEECIIFYFR